MRIPPGGGGAAPRKRVPADFVDEAGLRRVQPQRLADPVARPERIQPAVVGLEDGAMPLSRMLRPLAGDAGPGGHAPGFAQATEQEPFEVVALEVRAFEPPIAGSAVHDLDELDARSRRRARRGREHRPVAHELHERGEVVAVQDVVGGQVGHEPARGSVQAGVERGADARVLGQPVEGHARIG
jgi:hypothetical protein